METIDCHILYLPTDRSDWLAQAIQSVRNAGIEPRLVEGIPGSCGAARAKAYRSVPRGTLFCCHVDSDDWIGPCWIRCLLQGVRPEDNGAHSNQTIVNGRGEPLPASHTLAYGERHLFRREAMTDELLGRIEKMPRGSDIETYKGIVGWRHVPCDQYFYRRRPYWKNRV